MCVYAYRALFLLTASTLDVQIGMNKAPDTFCLCPFQVHVCPWVAVPTAKSQGKVSMLRTAGDHFNISINTKPRGEKLLVLFD